MTWPRRGTAATPVVLVASRSRSPITSFEHVAAMIRATPPRDKGISFEAVDAGLNASGLRYLMDIGTQLISAGFPGATGSSLTAISVRQRNPNQWVHSTLGLQVEEPPCPN